MGDALWQSLTDFTYAETGRPLFGKAPGLSPATRLLDDLGLDGYDAYEFVDKFFDQFNVANAESFPFDRYFGSEGVGPLALLAIVPALLRLILTGKRHESEHPLTLAMLLEAMRAGRWDTEAIESKCSQQS